MSLKPNLVNIYALLKPNGYDESWKFMIRMQKLQENVSGNFNAFNTENYLCCFLSVRRSGASMILTYRFRILSIYHIESTWNPQWKLQPIQTSRKCDLSSNKMPPIVGQLCVFLLFICILWCHSSLNIMHN